MSLINGVRLYAQEVMGGPYGKTLTARTVAQRGGLNENWLTSFLSGRRNTLSLENAEKLAAGLGVDLDTLVAEAKKRSGTRRAAVADYDAAGEGSFRVYQQGRKQAKRGNQTPKANGMHRSG